jgi:hypothetical protein
MKLKSMELTKKEAKESDSPRLVGEKKSGPSYPYGLRITLEDKAIEKLGLSSLPKVGSTLTLSAKVEVTAASVREGENGKQRDLTLQITDLAIEDEGSFDAGFESAAEDKEG